ncbi:MAG: hypothetical protein KGD60_10335 [Candidatus Thorarchaeota archaeon]|nr:hypothetical protein [Candidatus Thorarchaeota archaeon]
MTDIEVLTGPKSKIGLALCLVFYSLSGSFVINEYFILGAEMQNTGLMVHIFLISVILGITLSFGLLIPLTRKQRSKMDSILRIVLVISVIGLLLYLLMRM